jgi:hypothetical protein
MATGANHISDRDLILYIDAELSTLRRMAFERHLNRCRECRSRYTELQAAMKGLSAAILAEDWNAGQGEAEALLRARMAALPKSPAPHLYLARLTAAVAIGLSLIGAVLALRTRSGEHPGLTMPNRFLTPGAAVPVSREMVCAATEADESASVSPALAITVFNHYGIRNPQARAYEVDYLITPSLGGAREVRNLWPQPYASGIWNSRVKDALEDRLRRMVCEGQMELEEAQKELARNWIEAYKRHFQTEEPLAEHRSFAKDPAWE